MIIVDIHYIVGVLWGSKNLDGTPTNVINVGRFPRK